jgi:hypothetical protein
MSDIINNDFLRLKRIALLSELEQLTGLHRDTIKRNYPDKLVRISKRRLGMRLEDALQLGRAAKA